MAEETKIEWADSTFNGWWGCTKIAPACDFCYAAVLDKRTGGDHWGNVARRRTSEKNWQEPLKWQRAAAKFLDENGHRRRVFCGSMKDWADNQVPPEWRSDLWSLIRDCPDLDWLMLTKRPQNIEKMKPEFWDEIKGRIWLGTTIEDQEHADRNVSHLLTHDSAVRFVSCEPLLGPLDLREWLHDSNCLWRGGICTCSEPRELGLDWVITGGESGPHARFSHPLWFHAIQQHCAAAGVAYLHKQNGEWVDYAELGSGWTMTREVKGRAYGRLLSSDIGDAPAYLFDGDDFPAAYPWRTEAFVGPLMVRVGKHRAGRTIGRHEYDGFPA